MFQKFSHPPFLKKKKHIPNLPPQKKLPIISWISSSSSTKQPTHQRPLDPTWQRAASDWCWTFAWRPHSWICARWVFKLSCLGAEGTCKRIGVDWLKFWRLKCPVFFVGWIFVEVNNCWVWGARSWFRNKPKNTPKHHGFDSFDVGTRRLVKKSFGN